MQIKNEENVIIVKFESGEDVITDFNNVIDKYDIKSGLIDFAIGMIKDTTIGYWDNDHYEKMNIPERIEIVSFHGTIAENDPRYHIHISGARANHRIFGGHFFLGTADPLLEVRITKLNDVSLTRKFNDNSKLNELNIE